MSVHDQLHVVLGATGGAGGALVSELAGRGHRVRAVSRKPAADLPEGVEQRAADAADPAQTRKACEGATVVYHCVQPPYQRWAAEIPPLMAERLLAAHRSGTLQVAIGRSSDYYGPGGANSFVGDILFGAAAKGNRARWLGRLDVPHSLNYLQDVARALVTLGARQEAPGEVWHLPAAEPLTGRAFVELIAAALDRPVKVTAI